MSAKTVQDIAKELAEQGNMDAQEADALIAELEEWQVWGAHAVGGSIGFFTPLFAFDAIDKAIDGSDLDDKWKAGLKWLERGGDLALGVIGTATNIVPISEGNGKWYNHLLSSMSVMQIPFSIYKMLELGGVVGGGEGVNTKRTPEQMRQEMDRKMRDLEGQSEDVAARKAELDAQTKLPTSRGQEIKILT